MTLTLQSQETVVLLEGQKNSAPIKGSHSGGLQKYQPPTRRSSEPRHFHGYMLNMTTLNYQPWKLHSTRSTWVDFTLLPLNWGSLTCQSSNTNPKHLYTHFLKGKFMQHQSVVGNVARYFFKWAVPNIT